MYYVKKLRLNTYDVQMKEMGKGEFFESEVYLEEVSDVLCIAQAGSSLLTVLNYFIWKYLHMKKSSTG